MCGYGKSLTHLQPVLLFKDSGHVVGAIKEKSKSIACFLPLSLRIGRLRANLVLRSTVGFFADTPMLIIRSKPHFIEQQIGGPVRCHLCSIGKNASCGSSSAERTIMSAICRVAKIVWNGWL